MKYVAVFKKMNIKVRCHISKINCYYELKTVDVHTNGSFETKAGYAQQSSKFYHNCEVPIH